MYILSAVLKNGQTTVALYDEAYKLLAKKAESQADLAALCSQLLSERELPMADVKHLGIAVDGTRASSQALAEETEQKLGIRCYVASTAGAGALGEAYLAGDLPSLILLNVDDTVQSGIVIDKRLYTGIKQLGGNVAHTVLHFEGYECTCGRKGCFEAYVGKAGLCRVAAESGIKDADSVTYVKLFAMRTPEAERAKQLSVKYLANGIINVINLFQPNELVLQGPFTEVGDALMAPLMETVLNEQYTHSMPNKCKIRIADKATDATPLGAALLGR